MAIVILVSRGTGGDEIKTFGGIECDVEGCGTLAPPEPNRRQSLLDLGWFIEPGKHRCPQHFDTDAPARGPQHRHVEHATKAI